MGKPPQHLVAAVVMDDRLADHRAETGHTVGKPFRHLSAVQREIGGPSPLRHQSNIAREWMEHGGRPPRNQAWSRRRSDRPGR